MTMPNLTVENKRMGAWRFIGTPEVIACHVDVNYEIRVDNNWTISGPKSIDIWPLLTEGQRQQLQRIVGAVQALCENA